jgi:hypothetical protein
MKHVFLAAVAALALTAAPALAQMGPPPGTPGPAMRQQFEQMHRQMMQIHQRARTTILAALTPEHKALLAQVVGQLAIANTPDVDAAAARLDAALSSGEKQAILNAARTAHSQMRGAMQAMRNAMPPPPPDHGMMMRMHENEPQDPGHILLLIAMPHPDM